MSYLPLISTQTSKGTHIAHLYIKFIYFSGDPHVGQSQQRYSTAKIMTAMVLLTMMSAFLLMERIRPVNPKNTILLTS